MPAVRTVRREAHRGGRGLRVDHLRCDGPLPDQVVQRELIPHEFSGDFCGRTEGVARGSNRFVRLLRVLDLAVVKPRLVWHILAAVQLPGLATSGVQCLLGQRGGVGSHVGDVAVLVKRLGDPHGPLRTPPKAPGSFLLQRRGHEGWLRLPGGRLLSHRVDREGLSSERRRQRLGRRLIQVDSPLAGQSPVVVEVRPRCDPRPIDRR